MSNLEPSTPPPRHVEHATPSHVSPTSTTDTFALNAQNAAQNTALPQTFAGNQTPSIFQTNTIAPSPPANTFDTKSFPLSPLETTSHFLSTDNYDASPSPLSAGLRIHTNIIPGSKSTDASSNHPGSYKHQKNDCMCPSCHISLK